MPLDIEVGLGPCDIVLDRNLAQPNKGYSTSSLTFRPMSILAKRLDGSRCHWYGDMPKMIQETKTPYTLAASS